MLREPRYDARPFLACIGRVASTPDVRCLCGVARSLLRDRRRSGGARFNAATAGSHASTIVLSPAAAAPSAWIPSRPARSADRSTSPSGVTASEIVTPIWRKPGAVERAGGAAHPVDQGLPDLLQERSRRSIGRRLQRSPTAAVNPRCMFTPWSASPIAASSWVRKSRCSSIRAAASTTHRRTNSASRTNVPDDVEPTPPRRMVGPLTRWHLPSARPNLSSRSPPRRGVGDFPQICGNVRRCRT